MLHHLLALQISPTFIVTLITALLSLLGPTIGGFLAAEWSKFWLWVQALGPVWGSVVGSVAAAVGGAAFAWLEAHVPGISQWIPADIHNLSAEAIIGLLIGILNALFHVPPALKAARLRRGSAYKF